MSNLPGHHGNFVVRYVVDGSTDPTVVTIHGPQDDVHHGAFLIPVSRKVAWQVQVDGEDDGWAQVRVRTGVWTDAWEDMGQDLVGSPYPVGGHPGVSSWTQLSGTSEVPYTLATHWLLEVVLSPQDPRTNPDLRLAEGSTFYLDCAYAPESGLNPDEYGEPYLDGDQPFGRWEGDPHNSTSVYLIASS